MRRKRCASRVPIDSQSSRLLVDFGRRFSFWTGRDWLEQREQELLDVEYFHVVFTLPSELAPLALQNRRAVYGMLFRAASETLLTLARDPRHLGAELGCMAVLHTWGQNLHAHPHLHCIVPGGGIGLDAERWVSCRDGFFLPVRVLSRLFRGKFIAQLQQAWEQQQLRFHGSLRQLEHPKAWEACLESLRDKDWVVYAKPPFGGPQQVLKYLARYTHRVAISRLVSVEDGKVTFRWKDYAHGNRQRTMSLDAVEFLRRFLLHVLPKGFMRIRYYGFLANRHRAEKLQRARQLLDGAEPSSVSDDGAEVKQADGTLLQQADELERCPECKLGRLLVVRVMARPDRAIESWSFDSS